jgi:hypothetical protein
MRGDPFVCSCFFVRNDEELSIFINFPRWLCAPVLMDHGSWMGPSSARFVISILWPWYI